MSDIVGVEEQERKDFERWLKVYDVHLQKYPLRGVHNQWTGEWAYTYSETDALWNAWMARAIRGKK